MNALMATRRENGQVDREADAAPNSGGVAVASLPLDFHELYERWFDDVARWVRMMGGPEADSEDLVQDVFLVVHRRLPDFDGANVPGWLYQIARHRVRDFRRLAWVRKILFGAIPLSPNLAMDAASPSESLETTQKRALLEQALATMNESERVALLLFEVHGRTGAAIAQIQGVPLNTAWARLYNARRKLKEWLAKMERDERALAGPSSRRLR